MATDYDLDYAIKNYDPDKEKYFRKPENKYVKEMRKEHEKLRNLHRFSKRSATKIDDEDITERRKAILSSEQEQRAIKTLNSFTPEEVENKTFMAQMVSSDEKMMELLAKTQMDYQNGKLKEKSEGIFDKKDEEIMKSHSGKSGSDYEKYKEKAIDRSKRFQKFFENYELLGNHRDDKNGLYVYVFGNYKTGELDFFVPGTNPDNEVEVRNNNRAYAETTDSQKALLEYAKEFDRQSKNGEIKGEKRIYNKGVSSINGHSQGGASSIFASSYMPNMKCLANEPGPVVEVGPYVKDNAILAVIPNNGHGKFNYAEKIEGSHFSTLHSITGNDAGKGENQTSLITALPVDGIKGKLIGNQKKEALKAYRAGKNFNIYNTHLVHGTDAEKAGNALKTMQEYARAVEPKLEKFLSEKKNQNKRTESQYYSFTSGITAENKEKKPVFKNFEKRKKTDLQSLVSDGKSVKKEKTVQTNFSR
jgi:hypothetical protein